MGGTIIQLAAFIGAVGSHGSNLVNVTGRLPFDEASTAALAGRAIALDLVARDAEAVLSLTERGRAFLLEGETYIRPALASQTGTRRPVADTFRQRAWTAMRLSQRFTTGSIVLLAARPDETYAHDNLRRYLMALCRAGYCAQLPKRTQGGGNPAVWKIIDDTGPHAPVLRKRGTTMFDPNLGTHRDLMREVADAA
jgi:hypothetical protein